MNRLRPCKQPGCPNLVKSGYCEKHVKYKPENPKRKGFEKLDKKKSLKEIRFYRSSKWTKTSVVHRVHEPLCRRCRERGVIKAAEMVHHCPDLKTLWELHKNPYDHKYLVSLCNRCHLEDLRKKRKYARI